MASVPLDTYTSPYLSSSNTASNEDDASTAKEVTSSANTREELDKGFREIVPDNVLQRLGITRVVYIVSETVANNELQHIVNAVVGFDTEYGKRTPTATEQLILGMQTPSATVKKTAKAVLQYLELISKEGYQISWEATGLCIIQLSLGNTAWLLNMKRIKAFPKELKRILTSSSVALAGVGLLSDAAVVWEDLRVDMQQLVDVGLMTRLYKPEDFPEEPFQNVALDVAAHKILKIVIDKSRQKTVDWAKEPSDIDLRYAAIDAAACLRLYEILCTALRIKEASLGKQIPVGWYTYHMTEGEPTRLEKSYRGSIIPWSTKDCSCVLHNP
ncbi:ribonuclease H-like domain-containing protein [Mycena galericulata]|nr:ribonuclease H-like domain-containing protein [Mycena galericulata]